MRIAGPVVTTHAGTTWHIVVKDGPKRFSRNTAVRCGLDFTPWDIARRLDGRELGARSVVCGRCVIAEKAHRKRKRRGR